MSKQLLCGCYDRCQVIGHAGLSANYNRAAAPEIPKDLKEEYKQLCKDRGYITGAYEKTVGMRERLPVINKRLAEIERVAKAEQERATWKYLAELSEEQNRKDRAEIDKLEQELAEAKGWRRKYFEIERAHSQAVDKIAALIDRIQLRERELAERGSQKSALEQELAALRDEGKENIG